MGGDRVQMFSVWGAISPGGEGTQRRKAAGQGTNASAFGAPNHQAGRGRKGARRGRREGGREGGEERREEVRWVR